jgi:hypothetical protein
MISNRISNSLSLSKQSLTMNRFTFGNARDSSFAISLVQLLDSELRNLATNNDGHVTCTWYISFYL